MKTCNRTTAVWAGCALLLAATGVGAQDWPQWRGPNRDAKATGFKAPATWPKELKQQWKVKVGDGVASPALVGDKLFVFSREGDNEVVRCLDLANGGKELWLDKDNQPFRSAGGDNGYPGPRSSPAVADGKVVTLGVNGVLSCLDAASGKVLWRKDEYKGAYPRFHTSSSPIIEGGLAIAQLGSDRNGGIVAYDLAKGEEKWKWMGGGPAYASPSVMTVGDTKALVAETEGKVVAVNLADGKLLWETAWAVGGGGGGGGGGRGYNAASPMVEGQTLILNGSGRGLKAVKAEKDGDKLTAKDLWSNRDNSTQFNTPVLAGGHVYGLSATNTLFCVDAESGKTTWSKSLAGGGGGGGRGGGGYGSVVDAGSVLMALTPAGELVVVEANPKEYKEVARYKVGDNTYAYPIVSGNRLIVKDRDSVILWTVE